MDWAQWRPRGDTLQLIKGLLQDALIPESEVQRNVQSKLKSLQNVNDFAFYLLYIVGEKQCPVEIRSLAGILLKNNIEAIYDKLPQGSGQEIRNLCLMLLRDPCRDVRTSIAHVIYSFARHGLRTWPELIPFLVSSFEAGGEHSDVALTTLLSVCEDLLLVTKREEDEEICAITKELFPKFMGYLRDEKCNLKQSIVKLMHHCLEDHFQIAKQSMDLGQYLEIIMQLANTDDLEMLKHVCHAFVMYVKYREECLLPHLHQVIFYIFEKTQHEDIDVALSASEFWLALTSLPNCKEILVVYIEKLVPVLLKNMKYSTFELVALSDTYRAEDQIGLKQENFPLHVHQQSRKCKTGSDDSCSEDEMYMDGDGGNSDDYNDFYVGWTLRKCSAATLDAISLKFGDDILPLIVPFLNELLHHQDFLIKEAAILALGAISQGCLNGLKPYLPSLIEYLINSMIDSHSMVRVIICWTLSRYTNWIISSHSSHSVFFIPVMTTLLKYFTDDNRRVQRAAISAFCVFEEEAGMHLIPYIDLILDGFFAGFLKYNSRTFYLLCDAINVLAFSVGCELSKSRYVDKLMPPLMSKLETANFFDEQFIAVLECIGSIISSLRLGILPYAERLFSLCVDVIVDTLTADTDYQKNRNLYDSPDKESMQASLEVLYSMALALKTYFYSYVSNSVLVSILYTTMQDPVLPIRQSSLALYGELVVICYPYLASNIEGYIELLIKSLGEEHEGVCKNTAWVFCKIALAMGVEINKYSSQILPAFINILIRPMTSRAVQQIVSIAFCTIYYISPDIPPTNIESVIKILYLSLASLRDCEDKERAFRGLCQIIVRHPDLCLNNFSLFCDAITSWSSIKPDLKEIIKTILGMVKQQCGEQGWFLIYCQFSELLKQKLYVLYGV